MTQISRSVAAATAALALLLGAAAYADNTTGTGESGSAGGVSSPSVPASQSTVPSRSAPSSGPGPASESASVPVATASAGSGSGSSDSASLSDLALTASEVGTGYTQIPDTSSDSPPPCTPKAQPLITQFPPDAKLRTAFRNAADSVEIEQVVVSFDDSSTVSKLVAATEAGLNCAMGTVGGVSVELKSTTVSAPSGISVFKRWDGEIASQNLELSYFLMTRGSTAELLAFVAKKAVAASVSVKEPVLAALQKLVAH